MLVARVGDRSGDRAAGRELASEVDAEPLRELAGVGEGAPDAGARGPEDDLLLDAIGDGSAMCNLLVALNLHPADDRKCNRRRLRPAPSAMAG